MIISRHLHSSSRAGGKGGSAIGRSGSWGGLWAATHFVEVGHSRGRLCHTELPAVGGLWSAAGGDNLAAFPAE